jgi:cytochrome c-type biogenesis protein
MGVAVQEASAQRSVLGHALMFIAGFTLVFVAFGATAGLLLGSILRTGFERPLTALGGVLLIILGFHMGGILKWLVGRLDKVPSIQTPLVWIDRKLDELILPERRKQAGYGQAPGFIRSGIVGAAFAAGWTPCVGPLYGAILFIAANAARTASPTVAVLQSTVLLFAYSMGLAIPFLITAWILSIGSGLLRRINRHLNIVEKTSAILLIGIGLLLVFGGTISTLNQYFSFLADQPDWISQLEYVLSNYGINIPIAILAGLLSFLSPCVLPLIPVYLGYLTGVATVNSPEATA